MWLRNPYSRLLSGFLDKGVQEFTFVNMAGYEYPFEPTPDGFKLFLESLLDMRRKGLPINPHFKPQSELCGIPFGMQYDFYLKVEDIHLWYPDLISLLGLRDTVYSGWGYASNSQLVRAAHTTKPAHHFDGVTDASTYRQSYKILIKNRNTYYV
jgi:hypothetical protein